MKSRVCPKFSRCKAKALSIIQLQLKLRKEATLEQTDAEFCDFATHFDVKISTPMPKHRENCWQAYTNYRKG